MERGRFAAILIGASLLALMLLLTGCIGHHFLYKFNVDGTCDFSYRARGDSLDIYSPQGSYPTEPLFKISTRTEVDTSGNETYILEATARLSPDSLPSTLGLKEVPWTEVFLKHPARMVRTPLFFLSLYKFEGAFKGRDRTALEGDRWSYIPEECRLLESKEDTTLSDEVRQLLEEKYAAGTSIWNTERYKLRMRQILERTLALHPEIKAPQAWIDSALVEVDSLIQAYAAAMEHQDLDMANLEWWDDLSSAASQILFENLNFIGDTTLQGEIVHVGDLLEMQHRVTEDLMDESFEVQANLPGRVISSNAEAMDTGVLVWKFDGSDLADKDYSMKALSVYLFAGRIVGTLVLIVAVILAVRFRRPKETVGSSEPPRPSHESVPPIGHG